MISFACFSPHPPLLLPDIGSPEDREKVKKTISSLNFLGKKLKEVNPDAIIISSPHSDWGFQVPLYFLASNYKGKVEEYLIGSESPIFYFEEGKKIYKSKIKNQKSKIALIASGDMSHCLKEDGPYGLHPNGAKFDQELIESLKKKDIENILKLDDKYPQAGECGLRSFAFILGILKESKINYQPEILSYEGPFGVGYLVVDFNLDKK